jgi:hypothetical protein
MPSIPGQIINLQVDIEALKQSFISGPDIQDILFQILTNITDLNTPVANTYNQLLMIRDRIQAIEDIHSRQLARTSLTSFIQSLRNFLNWYWDLSDEDRYLVASLNA